MSLEWRGAAVTPGDGAPTPDEWTPVAVPGRPARFAGADAVAYETTFDDPRESAGDHAILVLHGAYAHTRVWCNDELLAEHDAYVAPLRVPLPDAEWCRVVVECRAPEDRFGGLHDTEALPEERCVPGIWWRAAVETRPDPYVEALDLGSRLTESGAEVDVAATVVSREALDERLTTSLRPTGDSPGGGMMGRSQVTSEAGRATVTDTIEVRDPALWWPHDRGRQPRYTVSARLGDDSHSVTTGLGTTAFDGEDGLVVNGEYVPVRGTTLLDPRPEDVAAAVDANANLVRVRAQGAPPSVVEACDTHGVMLWQDLPLTGPGRFDPDRGTALAEALCTTYDHHPSLAMLSVHDTPVENYAAGLGSGRVDRLRFRWRAWRAGYDATAAESVAESVDGVPTLPVVGPPGIDPDAVTLFPGWAYGSVADLDWLCRRYDVGDVVGAFGAGALGTEDPDDAGFDRATHDRQVSNGVEASQTAQARTVRRVAENLRAREAVVVVQETLRDVGDAGMGVLARDGTPKSAQHGLASSYEPTTVVLTEPTPGRCDILVVHDQPTTETLTVEWDHGGEREQVEETVGPFGRVVVGTLDLAPGDDVTLAVAVRERVVTAQYEVGTAE